MFPESLSPEVLAAFSEHFSVVSVLLTLLGVIAAGVAFAVIAIPTTARVLLPYPREDRLADVLPFEKVLSDGKTIACKNGDLVQCVEMMGFDDTFMSDHDREMLLLARKDWIDALQDYHVSIRAFTVRERVDVAPPTTHTNPVLREIAKRWNGTFARAYSNRQFVVFSLPDKDQTSQKKLNSVIDITQNILHKYGPMVMTQGHPDVKMRPLYVFSRIVSPISQPVPGGVGDGASDAICGDQVEFGGDDGGILFRSGHKTLHCCCVGLRALGDFTYEAYVNSLNSVHGEIIVSHVIEPWTKTKAAIHITHQYKLSLAQRFSPGTAAQFETALDAVEGNTGGTNVLSQYMMMVFCYGKTVEEMEATEAEVKRIASTYGISVVREGAVAQASWFLQFPSFKLWPRPYKLFSKNIATHLTFERPSPGLTSSDWGKGPIANFRTISGTPYAFQFHISPEKAAVAHAVSIGPTGGGKTTLINFLAGMAMRHEDLRYYMVDRHGGGYLFTCAASGSYITFEGSNIPGIQSSMNPFQLKDNASNRSFLRAFLQALSDCQDADAIEEIGFSIEAAYDTPGLPYERRSLANIYDAVYSKGGMLRKNLHKWVDPAVYGKIFNAKQDTLDLKTSRIVALDFTRLYEHDDLARAVILYLMHRIQDTISELKAPALIFIDETEPVVKHPIFRNYFLQMLQEYRKRRGAVISAFQRPEAITQAGLGEAIRGQAQTTFFFPNPQGQAREYQDWGLTEREWLYISGKLPAAKKLKRSVLMKRASGESIILDTDLSALGRLMRIYYSDEPSRALAERLMQNYQSEWLNIYLDSDS